MRIPSLAAVVEGIHSASRRAPAPMTDIRHRVLLAIGEAVRDVNEHLPAERRVPEDPSVTLAGAGGVLDSLGLVNLVMAVEQRISDALGVAVILTDDPRLFEPSGPLSSVQRLAEHITALLEGSTDA